MGVYEAVRTRRAVRGFSDEAVSREVLERVLSAAAWSPSGSNLQPWNSYVLTGALTFTLDGRDITVRPGELLRIPSWMPHSAEAIEDTFELDLFSPIRQDWIDGTDDYFRK